jgi:hypothetical protein
MKIQLDEPRAWKADAFRSVEFEDSLKLYTSIMDWLRTYQDEF